MLKLMIWPNLTKIPTLKYLFRQNTELEGSFKEILKNKNTE